MVLAILRDFYLTVARACTEGTHPHALHAEYMVTYVAAYTLGS